MAGITKTSKKEAPSSEEFFIGKYSGHLYRKQLNGSFVNLKTGECNIDQSKFTPCVIGEVYRLEIDK